MGLKEIATDLKKKNQTGVLHSKIYKFEAKSSNQNSQNSEVV